jgi:pimeloyl-ACP methyl ester carboxylesterase
MMWHFIEQGQGRPLVLLHGIGMSNAAWKPVLSKLAESRRVIVFDIAGFGRSPLLPQSTPPTIINLVLELGNVLRKMGIDEPVDIAGNSLGAWMALEAARLGMARSVVAISPGGLWQKPM